MPQSPRASQLTLLEPSTTPSRHYRRATSSLTLERRFDHDEQPEADSVVGLHPGISAVAETVIEKLSRREGLLNSKQVIGLLGVHITTLQLWTRRGDIPFLRVGRSVRFDPAELAEWLGKRQIGG